MAAVHHIVDRTLRGGCTVSGRVRFGSWGRASRAPPRPTPPPAWHPPRPIAATASADLTIRLWDLDTGRRLEEFRGPINAPQELAFSPSGHLIGCAVDGDVTRLWEPEALQ